MAVARAVEKDKLIALRLPRSEYQRLREHADSRHGGNVSAALRELITAIPGHTQRVTKSAQATAGEGTPRS